MGRTPLGHQRSSMEPTPGAPRIRNKNRFRDGIDPDDYDIVAKAARAALLNETNNDRAPSSDFIGQIVKHAFY